MGPKQKRRWRGRRKGKNKDGVAAAEGAVGDDAGEAAGGGDGPTAAAGGGGRPASTGTAEDGPPVVAQSTPPSPPVAATATATTNGAQSVDNDADGGRRHAGDGPRAAGAGGGGRQRAVLGGSAPRPGATVTAKSAAAEGAQRASASAPQGPSTSRQPSPQAAAMVQSSPQASATPQSSSRAAPTSKAQSVGVGGDTMEKKDVPAGDAQQHKKPAGVDGEDTNGGGSDGGDTSKPLLEQIVVSWAVKDVLSDDDLSKVRKIPTHFTCVDEYLDVYSHFILEETRSSLKTSLSNLSTAPYYCMREMQRCETPDILFADIHLGEIKLDSNHSYRMAKDGDVFLFSSHPPHTGDLNFSLAYFGIAFDNSQYKSFHKGFKVLVSYTNYIKCSEKIKFATFLINVKDALNTWRALSFKKTEDNCAGLKSVLNLAEMANIDCRTFQNSFDIENVNLCLSQEQLYCLKSVISVVICKCQSQVELIQGPPGSGKTQIVTTLLQVLHHLNLNVMVCVPKAGDCVKLLSKLDTCLFPLDDALVLDDLESTNKFQMHTLSHRSQNVLVDLRLFKQWLGEMTLLLNLDPYCTRNCKHESSTDRCTSSSRLLFTLHSFKDKFTKLMIRKPWLTNLKERFSKLFLSDNNVKDITILLSMLMNFEELCDDELHNRHVQQEFRVRLDACKLEGDHAAKRLNDLRLQCVDYIERFRNSINLPKFVDRKSLEDFCIHHAKVIISTTQPSFRLHEAAMEPIDLFIIDDADKINECDLIIPLRLPVKNILILGDDFTIHPLIKSTVCENDGFATSLFKRLLNLGFQKHMLMEQYAIHPSIWQFPNEKYYKGSITNGATVVCPEYNRKFEALKFPNYCFIDVTGMEGPGCIEKNTVELVAIKHMLEIISQSLEETDQVLDVGVLCLCDSNIGGIKSSLRKKYATHNRINLRIESVDSFEGETYQVVILSMLFKDKNSTLQIEKINAALTRARYFLWMFGEVDNVSARGGILKELVADVIERKCIFKWDTVATSISKYTLESDNFHGPSSAGLNKTAQKVFKEFTWYGRPKRTKYILAPLRDQGNSDTCTMHSCLAAMESMNKHRCACMEPPQDFNWILSTDNLMEEYKIVVGKKLGSEEIEEKGNRRLDTVLQILKDIGVIGRTNQQPEVTSRFNIKSHSQLPIKEEKDKIAAWNTIKKEKY